MSLSDFTTMIWVLCYEGRWDAREGKANLACVKRDLLRDYVRTAPPSLLKQVAVDAICDIQYELNMRSAASA